MEWWAIFLMVVVLFLLAVCVVYFVVKIYFPYHFATFSYHVSTGGRYASDEAPTLATFRSRSDGDIIFTETGCYAKPNTTSSKSMLSVSNDDLEVTTDSTILLETTQTPLGQIQVGMDVDYDTSELIVLIIQGKKIKLPESIDIKSDIKDLDLYACVDLIHSEDIVSSAKTKVHEKETSPSFKERFLFKVVISELPKKIIRFRIIGITKQDAHIEISKAVVQISDVDLTKAKKLWLNLKEMNTEENSRGEIMLSLTYLPTASRITLVIIKAKNLRWKVLRQKFGDIMISVSLISNGRRICKRQTSVKRKAKEPIFNESLIFSVNEPVDNVFLRLTASEILPTGRLYTVGHCILGSTGSGMELTHWQQMISNPRRPSAMWHWLQKASKKSKFISKTKANGQSSIVPTSDSEAVHDGTDYEGNGENRDLSPQEASESLNDLINL